MLYPFLATGSNDTVAGVEEFLTRHGYRIAPVSVDYHDYSYAGVYVRHLRAGGTQKAAEQFATVLVALDDTFARAEARSVVAAVRGTVHPDAIRCLGRGLSVDAGIACGGPFAGTRT